MMILEKFSECFYFTIQGFYTIILISAKRLETEILYETNKRCAYAYILALG